MFGGAGLIGGRLGQLASQDRLSQYNSAQCQEAQVRAELWAAYAGTPKIKYIGDSTIEQLQHEVDEWLKDTV